MPAPTRLAVAALASAIVSVACCTSAPREDAPAVRAAAPADARAHLDLVVTSRFCATCHQAIYAEHMQNTHGLAFVDDEARLATRDFRRDNCVRCHTPRPVSETGIGMVPVERRFDLEEGNTCMTCHQKAGYDYSRFRGGAECKGAFDGRVGEVQACATCHRIAGTPEQWEHAEKGNLAGRKCVDCHMPLVERPVAAGGPTKMVRSHTFPASHSGEQLRRAYDYDAQIEGNEVVVRVTNKGAGHNFPTASQQRSLESLVVIRDAEGNEVTRTRAVFKHPYAQATGLEMPVPTQIPSGQTREQRIPVHVAAGTVECELFFKNYYPVEDDHPQLSRRLERRVLKFQDVAPSTRPVDVMPRIGAPIAEVSPEEAARPDRLAKFAHPAPGTKLAPIPTGDSPDDVAHLVALLEFPVPEARARARDRLRALGDRAVPALVGALGAWSDETFEQAIDVLVEMGAGATPAVTAALRSEQLYVRHHARGVLARTGFPGDRDALRAQFVADLSSAQPLDRRDSAEMLGRLGDARSAPSLRPLLADEDWDVVASAARALALLGDRDALAELHAALQRATFVESRRDLAAAIAALGDPSGVPVLLDGLDYADDIIRRTYFDAFFAATGLHLGYDADAPRRDRLESLAALRSLWEQKGGAAMLRRPVVQDLASHRRALAMVDELGGGTDVAPGGDDEALMNSLVAMRGDAVPALIQGLTFPAGFTRKRALVCEALGKIGDPRAVPYLLGALRDPNLSVSAWACWAVERTGDAAAIPALRRYSRRLAAYADGHPQAAGRESPERLVARAARTRLHLGDESARREIDDGGGDPAALAAVPPSRVGGMVPTTEAQPVPVPTSPQDAVEKATTLRAQDYYEDAVAVLKDSDARFGATPGTRLEMSWNLLMMAEEDMTRDLDRFRIDAEVADARVRFDEAVRMDPRVSGRELLEARILRYEGMTDRARAVIEAYAARNPNDAAAHQEFGEFAYKAGDWAVAEREYSAVARLLPKDGWAVLYSTIARERLGHPIAELDEGYVAAARLLPEVQSPFRFLSRLHPDDPARFLELLQKVIDDRPRAVWARIWVAYVWRTRKDPDVARAEKVLREALAIAPRDQAVHFNLAQLFESQSRTLDAVREYVESVEAGAIGNVGDASDALDRLLCAAGTTDVVPADLRARAWDAVVSRSPSNGRYAHDAGRWYADVAHDPKTARRYLEAAAAADPDDETYRADVLRAKSDPRLGQ